METKKKLLEAGDVVFRTRRGYSGVEEYKITRVTPTLAISQHYRFKREVMGGYVSVHPYKPFNPYTYQLPTPSLQAQLQTQNLRRELKYWFNDEDNQPTLPQLLSIKNILTQKEEDRVEWVKVEEVVGDVLTINSLEDGFYVGMDVNEEEDSRKIIFGEFGVKIPKDKKGEAKRVMFTQVNKIYPTHIIPLSQLLKLPTKPSK